MEESICIDNFKWQPVMVLIVDRLECVHCSALAIFMIMENNPMNNPVPDDKTISKIVPLCQACYISVVKEED